ncbi:MAG: OmpA family protein [Desmonostoc vinosum HA7617-LM4]|jgi:outer membrane protein OmpA-like peptidoglycan-associated protein|nr:OmpA family protein [Desmonostoc vinosum HA7617-LM4]
MAQVEDSNSQFVELNQKDVLQIDNFLDLLLELKIIEPSEPFFLSSPVENIQIEDSFIEEVEAPVEPISLQVCEIGLESSFAENEAGKIQEIEDNISSTFLEQSHPDNLEDTVAAFQKLQELLIGPELTELENLTTNINKNLTQLEHQINEPEALINLLLPLIAEILRLKVVESQEEIVQAIAPIIDSAIQSRIEQDKASMSIALAPAVPQAIYRQIHVAPEEVSEAIAPTMGRAIKKQIEIEQDAIVDALYPIIGSTIGKYMTETIRAINQQVEDTLSVAGIKRKIRAKLQGVSEAELILKEALPFTIQAIFLIHKVSGLIIADVQRSDAQKLESDMIAGMLTAIRSFANDCINQSGTVSELDAIDYGTSKIILEVAGYCYLAIVVQGEASKDFIPKIRQTLIQIVKIYGESIEKFDGDSSTISSQIYTFLQELQDDNLPKEKQQNKPSPLVIFGLTLLSITLIPWGIWQYRSGIIHDVENKTALALASTPELAVYRLTVEESQGKLKLTGRVPNQFLRGKAEQIAQATTPKWLIDNQILAVEVPADPVLAAAEVKRVGAVLNQMDGVAISTQYMSGRVSVEGTVNRNIDVIKISRAFEQIPGVKSVSSAVLVKPLQIKIRFYFKGNSANLIPGDLSSKLQRVKLFLNQHPMKQLNIIGYSYSSTSAIEVQQLALKRAKAVKQALINQGVEPSRLQVSSKTTLPPGIDPTQPVWLRRCVIVEPI